MNFTTSQRNSAWNSQLRFEVHDLIDNYVMNFRNFKRTSETVCQKFCEMHCKLTGWTPIDQSAGKVRENKSLTTSLSTWQTKDYYFNGNFCLKTLNPKKTWWRHLLYISNIYFFNDESSWDPCNLGVSGAVFGLYINLITDGSIVTSSVTLQVHALCCCH